MMIRVGMLILAAVGALTPPGFAGETKGGDVAIVVRPELPVENLTFGEVRKLLLGDRQFWTPGVRVTLLMRAPAARERDVILKNVYRMTDAEIRR